VSSVRIEIVDKVARLHVGAGAPPQEIPVTQLVKRIAARSDRKPDSAVIPEHVRAWRERGEAVALAMEFPPACRSVRWVASDSPDPFGIDTRYEIRRLSFPYVVVLSVFYQGTLTPINQLYYRTAPLSEGEDLLLTNLLNVAKHPGGLKSWVCLLNLSIHPSTSWHDKVRAIGEHVFATGWNRSAEHHEGHSYFNDSRSIDPRIASIDAWEEASRASPGFALEVPWHAARTTLTEQLEKMLGAVTPSVPIACADDMAGSFSASESAERRRRRRRWFL
jgi:hypothetical protein